MVAEVISKRNTVTGFSAAVNFTYPAAPTAGNLLVIAIAWRANETITGTPSGWSLATNGGNGSAIDSAVYYKIAGASEPTSANFTLSNAAFKAGAAFEFSGVYASSVLDVVNANASAGTAGTTGLTGTLSQPDELIFALFSSQNSTDSWSSHDNGLTEIVEINSGSGTASSNAVLSIATKIATVTDSVNYGATLSATRNWSSAVATFRGITRINGVSANISISPASGSLIVGTTLSGSASALNISTQTGQVAQGSVFDGSVANIIFAGQSGGIANVFNGLTGSLSVSAVPGVLLEGNTIDGNAIDLSLSAIAGYVSIGNIVDCAIGQVDFLALPGSPYLSCVIDGNIGQVTINAYAGTESYGRSIKSSLVLAAKISEFGIDASNSVDAINVSKNNFFINIKQ